MAIIPEQLEPDELIEFIKDSLQFLKKDFNLKNFFIELKRNGYSALKHLSHVAPYLKNKASLKDKEIIRKIVQLELADTLFRQGATAQEVLKETGIQVELLAGLLRSYYAELPQSLIQFKLMQYRLLQLIQQNKLFLESYVLPDLAAHGKLMAVGVLSTLTDMVLGNADDRVFMDAMANKMDKDSK